jgi:hypothetical protein
MLGAPEALSLLDKNMHLTVHLGDIFKNDPALLRKQMDSLNLVLAEQKARDTEDWKKEMRENPDAQKELQQSASDYAQENGYSNQELTNTDPKVIEHYVYVPYPYWSGYPWWYDYPYWYPYPMWYHSGFVFWNGELVWIGPPSWYFVHWHFHHHPHYYHYPHITNVYINHYYYGPRRSVSRNTQEVHEWMRSNESSLPRDFKSNTQQRVERIQELGKAEMDRDNFIKNNPGKTITRDNFIQEHQNDYPHLRQPAEEPLPEKREVPRVEEKPSARPKEDTKKPTDYSKPIPPVIHREPSKPSRKEPVKPTPKVSPEPSKKPVVVPRSVPSTKPPVQPRNDKQGPVRKK